MHIKITEPGWATYSGMLGFVEFKDGVSTSPVSHADAARIAGTMRVETVETGENPSYTHKMAVDRLSAAAPVGDVTLAAHQAPQDAPQDTPPQGEPAPVAHTKESLGALADQEGIKGLRAIAEPMGIRGNSIQDLIEKIVEAQG